jgi:hypothetical protein
MTELRSNLPPLPERLKRLPVEERGYPVPWFVEWIDGKPDFRVMSHSKFLDAVKFRKCWMCGGTLGRKAAFVIGPMCAVNRISAEPPSHRDCAVFAAQACPFLSMPKAKRREAGLPLDGYVPAGCSIPRNPGVALVWVTSDWKYFPAPNNRGGQGLLFMFGPYPIEVLWFAEGRPAARAEVEASIAGGLPALREMAAADGAAAVAELDVQLSKAMELLPP